MDVVRFTLDHFDLSISAFSEAAPIHHNAWFDAESNAYPLHRHAFYLVSARKEPIRTTSRYVSSYSVGI